MRNVREESKAMWDAIGIDLRTVGTRRGGVMVSAEGGETVRGVTRCEVMYIKRRFAMNRIWIAAAVVMGCIGMCAEEAQAVDWYNPDGGQAEWLNRREITFTADAGKIPSSQSNFPALISVADTRLGEKALSNGD